MIPHFEVPAGAIDGANVLFTTAMSYTPGSTAVFINGQLKRPAGVGILDGWTETSPVLGTVTLDEAPLTDDVVQIFYLDTNPLPLIVVQNVCDLEAEIRDIDQLSAEIEEVTEFDATLECVP
jgi:hypothetical protein